jgi:epoxyqueuosine reductase QueG
MVYYVGSPAITRLASRSREGTAEFAGAFGTSDVSATVRQKLAALKAGIGVFSGQMRFSHE